jgi:hypothetical protein
METVAMPHFRRPFVVATGVAMLTLSMAASSVAAQGTPVGTPGTPQCHGQRISAGNQRVEDIVIPPLGVDLQNYRLTPPHRAALLNTFQEEGRTDWSVQDFQARVRAACQGS